MAFSLVGQTSSALRSSTSQNLAAVSSSHSLAETVLHLAMTLLGLISTEHSVLLLSILSGVAGRIYTPTQPNNVLLYRINGKKSRNFLRFASNFSRNFCPLVADFSPHHNILWKSSWKCGKRKGAENTLCPAFFSFFAGFCFLLPV